MQQLPEKTSGDSRQLPEYLQHSGDLDIPSILMDDSWSFSDSSIDDESDSDGERDSDGNGDSPEPARPECSSELEVHDLDSKTEEALSPPSPPVILADDHLHDYLAAEEFKGNLEFFSGKITVTSKLRAILFWLREQRKPADLQKGWKALAHSFYAASSIELQPTQFRKIVANRTKLLDAYLAGDKKRARLGGAGRKSSVSIASQKSCADKIRHAASVGRHVDRLEAKKLLGTISDGVLDRFLKKYSLREKRAEVSTKISIEQIKLQIFTRRLSGCLIRPKGLFAPTK